MIVNDIHTISLKNDQVALQWLGQAGFLIKTISGIVIAIDPYLTDSVEKALGPEFKRLTLPVMQPEELKPDVLLITHHHEDHYDIETVPVIMSYSKTEMICCRVSGEKAIQSGIDKDRIHQLKSGETYNFREIEIKAVYANHGKLAPFAIGFLLKVHTIRIYITGDTSYVPEEIRKDVPYGVDIMIAPINGTYGNLNGKEVASLGNDVRAAEVIPCHFWTFTKHRGDPQEFLDAMPKLAQLSQPVILCQGEIYVYGK